MLYFLESFFNQKFKQYLSFEDPLKVVWNQRVSVCSNHGLLSSTFSKLKSQPASLVVAVPFNTWKNGHNNCSNLRFINKIVKSDTLWMQRGCPNYFHTLLKENVSCWTVYFTVLLSITLSCRRFYRRFSGNTKLQKSFAFWWQCVILAIIFWKLTCWMDLDGSYMYYYMVALLLSISSIRASNVQSWHPWGG